jgi:hypothetical protein
MVNKNPILIFYYFLSIEDFIISPPQADHLFIMTNFIRIDQEYKHCPGMSR